jgi:hypothetical protein
VSTPVAQFKPIVLLFPNQKSFSGVDDFLHERFVNNGVSPVCQLFRMFLRCSCETGTNLQGEKLQIPINIAFLNVRPNSHGLRQGS